MSLLYEIASLTSNVSTFALKRVAKRGATNLPGTLALKVDNTALKEAAQKKVSGQKFVVVGTNGKTSVTNLIADIFESSGISVLCNRGGANMKSGVTTAFLQGEKSDVAVIESDELWLKETLPDLSADYVLLLNLFRDQLDRCGEIERIQSSIVEALCLSPSTTLVYNADDPLCAHVAEMAASREERKKSPASLTFGINESLGLQNNTVIDTTMCQKCDSMLTYDFQIYDKLGKYKCDNCGFARPDLDFRAENVIIDQDGDTFKFCGGDKEITYTSSLKGAYNIYNLLVCAAAAEIADVEKEAAQCAFNKFAPSNGRLQTFEIAGKKTLLNLAKNPTGFNQNLRIIKTTADPCKSSAIAFFINDNTADGHDISWIWDIDFEELNDLENATFFSGGTRAADLSVRLKYADIKSNTIREVSDLFSSNFDEVFIVANYTALPEVKKELDLLAKDSVKIKGSEVLSAKIDYSQKPGILSTPEEKHDYVQSLKESRRSDVSHMFEDYKEEMDTSDLDDASEQQFSREPIRIAHVLPELLNLYGDGGNLKILKKRCSWRGIPADIVPVRQNELSDFSGFDLVFLGGGPDREQLFATRLLRSVKKELTSYIEDDGPLLAICGGYQILGKTWLFNGEEHEGLGILDFETRRPGTSADRLVSNIALRTQLCEHPVVGFENHAGRTYLGDGLEPFGNVVSKFGCGNCEEDMADGVVYKNLIGTYLHGPLLSKNPELADILIERAILRHKSRTGEEFVMRPLGSTCEVAARDYMLARIVA